MPPNNFPDAIAQSLPGTNLLRRVPGEYAADGTTPLYSSAEGSPRAVPTGRILVRFDEGVRFEDQAQSLAGIGFTVEESLPYAPHAGWVRAASGSIADALRNLDRVAALSGVRHVEPQLLYARAFK